MAPFERWYIMANPPSIKNKGVLIDLCCKEKNIWAMGGNKKLRSAHKNEICNPRVIDHIHEKSTNKPKNINSIINSIYKIKITPLALWKWWRTIPRESTLYGVIDVRSTVISVGIYRSLERRGVVTLKGEIYLNSGINSHQLKIWWEYAEELLNVVIKIYRFILFVQPTCMGHASQLDLQCAVMDFETLEQRFCNFFHKFIAGMSHRHNEMNC